jgi:hypothetical protein
MTIDYALTRTENVQGYFRSLRNSPRFLITILLYSFGFSVLFMMSSGPLSRILTLHGALTAAVTTLAFIFLLPVILFIRAKTARRSLTISADGISTEIGSLTGIVPWSKIKTFKETEHSILVAGANGNAFFIPHRAFIDPAHKAEFATQIKNWIASGTKGN